MTAPRHARGEAPWTGIARQDAHEWFRDHPGAPWAEFDAWAAEVWVPREFLRAGFDWQPGRSVDVEAFTDARRGLRAAAVDEARRRAGRDVPLSGHRSAGERPGPPVRVGTGRRRLVGGVMT